MSHVPVLDVVPPAQLRPIRPPSRLRSVFLVVVAFVLTTALGFIPAASATPALLIPVAKGVGATAASVLTAEAFSAMWNGTGDKPSDDDNSDSAKKGRGKWGSRLHSLRDIGAGILGSMFGLSELLDDNEEGSGLKMPEDFKDDAAKTEQGEPTLGRYRTWTITGVNWDRTYGAGGVFRGPRFDASCASMTPDVQRCPASNSASISNFVIMAQYECWDGTSFFNRASYFEVNMSGSFVSPGTPCNMGSGVVHPARSVFVYGQGSGTGFNDGLSTPQKFINPHFDQDQLPDDLATTVTADGVCKDPVSGETVTVSKTVKGLEVIPTVKCPVGWQPESISWTSDTAGIKENLGGIGTKTPDAYPDCPPGKCVRVITVDDVPCRVGVAECYDWQNVQPPSRVKCEYGPYDMPLAECADLQHIHKTEWGVTQDPRKDPERQPGWLPSNPDGTVDWTRVGTEYRPEDNPNDRYRPPVRGPIVNNPTLPDTDLPPLPNPGGDPPGFPGTGVNPPAPGNPKDPDTGQNCMAGAWSWNPVDWVFVPVKCALTWAFIPKGGDGMARIRDAFTVNGFGAWLAVPPAMFDQIPSGGGCMGPPLNMPAQLGGQTYYPFNACNDPAAKFAQMSRSVITLVVGFWGVFSIVNSISTALTGYRLFERESTALAKEAANK